MRRTCVRTYICTKQIVDADNNTIRQIKQLCVIYVYAIYSKDAHNTWLRASNLLHFVIIQAELSTF